MKNLNSFINVKINEYRTPGSKNKGPETLKAADGKDAEKNGSEGVFGVNEPQDNSAQKVEIDKDDMDKNMKRLLMKFKAEEDFFIQGEAGWAKTAIVKKLAKQFGREIVTVYLDKAVASDIGGIPIPVKGQTGAVQEMAMPAWAKIMEDNPDKKFLLFFDEMNQAAPDVMNALMPIVLEHEICGRKFGPKDEKGKVKESNFFVGAAGNYESENGAINELSGPLKSRFKPIIIWETGEEQWKSTFKFLHKEWDDKVGKNFVDKLWEFHDLFVNPRELDHKVIKFTHKLKQSGDTDLYDVEDFKDRLDDLKKDDLSRSDEDKVAKLAEYLFNFVSGKEEKKEESGRGEGRKDINMIDKNVTAAIRHGMKFGYIAQNENGKPVKYGISRENIGALVDEEDCNAEMLERIISKFEADGITFKYKKNQEWKDAGLKDPEAEDDENN